MGPFVREYFGGCSWDGPVRAEAWPALGGACALNWVRDINRLGLG